MTAFRTRRNPDGSTTTYPISSTEEALDRLMREKREQRIANFATCDLCGNLVPYTDLTENPYEFGEFYCKACISRETRIQASEPEAFDSPQLVQRASSRQPGTCSKCEISVPYGQMGTHYKQAHPEEAV